MEPNKRYEEINTVLQAKLQAIQQLHTALMLLHGVNYPVQKLVEAIRGVKFEGF